MLPTTYADPRGDARIIACYARALIDVYATARGNGFPIEVVRDETGNQNYYGLVLVE